MKCQALFGSLSVSTDGPVGSLDWLQCSNSVVPSSATRSFSSTRPPVGHRLAHLMAILNADLYVAGRLVRSACIRCLVLACCPCMRHDRSTAQARARARIPAQKKAATSGHMPATHTAERSEIRTPLLLGHTHDIQLAILQHRPASRHGSRPSNIRGLHLLACWVDRQSPKTDEPSPCAPDIGRHAHAVTLSRCDGGHAVLAIPHPSQQRRSDAGR